MNLYASVTVYEKKQVEKNYLLIEINWAKACEMA